MESTSNAVMLLDSTLSPRPAAIPPAAMAFGVLLIVASTVAIARPWKNPTWKRTFFAVALGLITAALFALVPVRISAQTPDAVQLGIERQLLCPQCTNLRLDVCDTQICIDMRAQIKERLARGESEQQIIEYFTGRYGDRVLAEVPKRGFNLVLFWWVGASMLAVTAIGSLVLVRLRRSARVTEGAATTAALDAQTEQWLDDQIAQDAPDHGRP